MTRKPLWLRLKIRYWVRLCSTLAYYRILVVTASARVWRRVNGDWWTVGFHLSDLGAEFQVSNLKRGATITCKDSAEAYSVAQELNYPNPFI